MCNNCDKNIIYKQDCYGSNIENCIELNVTKCDKGCEDVTSSDCIFHNITNDDKTSELPGIGIYKGTSLKYILRKISDRFLESINTNFSGFNMHGLNSNIEITNIKQFVEAITDSLDNLEEDVATLENETTLTNESIDVLSDIVSLNNIPGISDSVLNINTGDSVKIVLQKIITYILSNSYSSGIFNYKTIKGSSMIDVSEDNTSVVISYKVSQKPGNRLIEEEDGGYVIDPSISGILNSIDTNPALTLAFRDLINKTLPCFYFDIMSNINRTITYINCQGVEVVDTAKANTLLRLNNVKRIITPSTTGLTITFKGI